MAHNLRIYLYAKHYAHLYKGNVTRDIIYNIKSNFVKRDNIKLRLRYLKQRLYEFPKIIYTGKCGKSMHYSVEFSFQGFKQMFSYMS